MTEAESPWDDESRNWALALDDLEADQCPGCGSQLSETLRRPGQPFAKWDVSTVVCSRCEATEAIQHEAHVAEEKRREEQKNWHAPGGRIWTAKRLYPDWEPVAE